MPLDARTPVLVGAAAVQQREDDFRCAAEPLELMARALVGAANDAGKPALLARADSIRVPRGFWDYRDPGRALAERFGAADVRTQLAEIGVLQTTLLASAARDILEGQADVVLVTGGEARHRAQCARREGSEAPLTRQADIVPDQVLRPVAEIMHPLELRAGLVMPVMQYALIENALRAARGQTPDAQRDELAELWAGMSRVAADNPDAWRREPLSCAEIRDPGEHNPMVAFPYTKLHNSQWNVDQAAGLILTSLETADSLGIPAEKLVFPLAAAESNHMLPLSQRPALHRSFGFAHAGARACAHAGLAAEQLDHLELYSCFPVAVRVQQQEFGIGASRPVTVTGGMAFAGGPLNNFVLQALVRLAQVLRAEPGATGLVSAVSGMLTKQGVSLWASRAPDAGFAWHDVSEASARDTGMAELCDATQAEACVASCTVLFENGRPARTLFVCDLDDGRRSLAASPDPALAEQAQREELIGRRLRLADGTAELS